MHLTKQKETLTGTKSLLYCSQNVFAQIYIFEYTTNKLKSNTIKYKIERLMGPV